MFKTDTHVHTAEVSDCAWLHAHKMVKMYKEAGFDTIFITNHLGARFRNFLGDIPWKDKVTIFYSGYYIAKEWGRRTGLNVLPAAELTVSEQGVYNHYLLYGMEKSFLEEHEDIFEMDITEFYPLAKANNIYVVQAHPYRDGVPNPEYVDAIEVYNSSPRHDPKEEETLALVKQYDLPMTAGSDAHREEDVALAGVLSEKEIKTVEDYIELIKNKQALIYRADTGK